MTSFAFSAEKRRETIAIALLAPLLVALIAWAALAPWQSSTSVDNRSYVEMIAAISRHGLPKLDNGPVAEFPELQARWNRVQDGQLWGTLPPAFPYLAVPFFRIGGARAVVKLSIGLLAVLALGAFALGRAVTRDPLLGTATAYVTLCSAPVWISSLDTSPYSLAIAAITWSAAMGVQALDLPERDARKAAFASGLLGAIASSAHLLAFPIAIAIPLGLCVLPADESRPLLPGLRIGRRPTRSSLALGAYATLGLVLLMLPSAALNHLRFHSWNPISYGPCAWRSCSETGLDRQGVRAMLEYARPVFLWAFVTAVLVSSVRKHPAVRRWVVAAAVVALVPPSELHDHVLAMAATAWAFVVDVSRYDLGFGFRHVPDGLGNFSGPWVVKSLLQCTPAFLLALVARGRDAQSTRKITLLGLGSVALLASLALRANLPLAFALGFPIINFRYVMPVVPLLAALSVAAVRDLPWRRTSWVVFAFVVVTCSWALLRAEQDDSYDRRLFLLRVTLVVAVAALVLAARAKTGFASSHAVPAVLAAAVAFGVSTSVTLASDLRAMATVRRDNDRYALRIAERTPPRFALVGYPVEIDPALYLRASRDVQYADLYEGQNWNNFRRLIDVWTNDARPIFALFSGPRPPASPWPNVSFDVVDAQTGLYRVTRH